MCTHNPNKNIACTRFLMTCILSICTSFPALYNPADKRHRRFKTPGRAPRGMSCFEVHSLKRQWNFERQFQKLHYTEILLIISKNLMAGRPKNNSSSKFNVFCTTTVTRKTLFCWLPGVSRKNVYHNYANLAKTKHLTTWMQIHVLHWIFYDFESLQKFCLFRNRSFSFLE